METGLLKQLQAREQAEQDDDPQSHDAAALRCKGKKAPDQKELFELVDDADDAEPTDGSDGKKSRKQWPSDFIEGRTLWQLLEQFPGLDSIKPLWPHLWNFVARHRQHADGHLIPTPWKLRSKLGGDGGRKLNWQQYLTHEAAMIRLHSGTSAKRTSRMAAWASLHASMAQANKLAVMEKLEPGSVVLLFPPVGQGRTPEWRVACVLSLVWSFRFRPAVFVHNFCPRVQSFVC